MSVLAVTWPEAAVGATSVAALGLIIAVLIWQLFRTGQTAMRKEGAETQALVERLRSEVDELRSQLERSARPARTAAPAGRTDTEAGPVD